MARLTDQELSKAFVQETTPSFADIARQIEQMDDLKASRRRDLISGLRRMASILGWLMDELPADPV